MDNKLKIKSFFLSNQYDSLMFSICIAYSLTAIPLLEINELFKNIIILGSIPILIFKLMQTDTRDSNNIFWLFIASFIVQILSWLNSLDAIPEYAKSHPEIKHLSSLFLFIFIAFWINNDKKRTILLYSSLILGYIATALYDNATTGSFLIALKGGRVDYGMHNAQFTSMLSVVVIMLTLYIINIISFRTRVKKTLAYLLSGIIISFAIFSLLASQSRQVWLASAILALCIPLFSYKKLNIRKTLLAYLIIFTAGVTLFQLNIIEQRVTQESNVLTKLIDGDLDNIPMTSIGIRVNSWIEASKWIKENPILGTDRVSVPLVLKLSEKFSNHRYLEKFGHLHNFYVETLVSYGVVGLLFIIFFYQEVVKNITKNHNNSSELLLLLSFLIFWAIINLFESYNTKTLGIYAQTILLGGLFQYRKPLQ